MFRMAMFGVISAILVMGCVPERPDKAKKEATSEKKEKMDRKEMPKDHPQIQSSGPGLDLSALLANLPDGWTSVQPSSNMRVGQLSLARAAGDAADGEIAIFHFPGTGGSSMANLERWQGQMTGPHGEPGAQVAKTDSMKLDNGIIVITTDITGTLLASTMGTGPTSDQGNYRMIASVLETPGGNFFTKLTGPKATVAAHEKKYREFIKSAKLGSGGTM